MLLWQHKFYEERNKIQSLEIKIEELDNINKELGKLNNQLNHNSKESHKKSITLENPSEYNNSCLKSFIDHEK